MFRVTSHLALNCARLKSVLQKGTFPFAGGASNLLSRGGAQYLMFHISYTSLDPRRYERIKEQNYLGDICSSIPAVCLHLQLYQDIPHLNLSVKVC